MIDVIIRKKGSTEPIFKKSYHFFSVKDAKKLARLDLKDAGHRGDFEFFATTPKGREFSTIKV